VEWSITFGGVAVFLLMYMAFTKLFPMVSIWETRQDEPQLEPVPVPVGPSAQRLGSVVTMTVILLAALLIDAGYARADQKHGAKPPEATTLSLESHQVAVSKQESDEAQQNAEQVTGVARVFGRMLGWVPKGSNEEDQPHPQTVITATLRGAKGEALAYQVVTLSLKTSFGKLDYGARPTNADGKAVFALQDRRFGQYPVEANYAGGDQYAAARAVASIDFGPRPAPALPSHGVLIAPYATAAIGMPFLAFFGATWIAFIYIGVYLLWIRLPQIRRQQAKMGQNET
jgi:hypothetical protein